MGRREVERARGQSGSGAARWLLPAALFCGLWLAGARLQGEESLPPEVLEKAQAATVFLRVTLEGGEVRGTGFLVGPRLLVTNAHVLGLRDGGPEPKEVVAVFFSGVKAKEAAVKATLAGADLLGDLAFLALPPDLPFHPQPAPLPLASGDQLRETEPVYILGFPFGEALALRASPEITIGPGNISSLRLTRAGALTRVQVNGNLNPGNSGGPIINRQGRAVGVSVAALAGTQIGLAVPCDAVQSGMEGRPWGRKLTPRVRDGRLEADVLLATVDPLRKLKQVQVAFWTAQAGAERPVDAQAKRLVYGAPGDGPQVVVTTERDKSDTWKGTLRGLEARDEQEVWIQYVWTDKTDRQRSGDAISLGLARNWGKPAAPVPAAGEKPAQPQPPLLASDAPLPPPPKPVKPPVAEPFLEGKVEPDEKGHPCFHARARVLLTASLGGDLIQLVAHPTGKEVYAIYRGQSGIRVLDPRTLKPIGEIPTVRLPVSLWCDAFGMAVACSESCSLMLVDPDNRRPISSFQYQDDPTLQAAFVASRAPDGSLLTTWGQPQEQRPRYAVLRLGPDQSVQRLTEGSCNFVVAVNQGRWLWSAFLSSRPGRVGVPSLFSTTGAPVGFPMSVLPEPGFRRTFNRVFTTYDRRYVVLPTAVTVTWERTARELPWTYAMTPDLSKVAFSFAGMAFAEQPEQSFLVTFGHTLKEMAPQALEIRYVSGSNGAAFRCVELPSHPLESRGPPLRPRPWQRPGLGGSVGACRADVDLASVVTYVPGHELLLMRQPDDASGQVVVCQTGPVDPAAETRTPVLRGDPPFTAKGGQAYSWAPEAQWPVAPQKVHYKLRKAPPGATVEPGTGRVEWTPEPTVKEPQSFCLFADLDGREVLIRDWEVTVSD